MPIVKSSGIATRVAIGLAVACGFVLGCGPGPVPVLRDSGPAGSDGGADARVDAAPSTRCGDGVVGADEECDDGDTSPTDGCNVACGIEDGWSCAGSPSLCERGCGDGVVAAAEGCDDGAMMAGDGCSPACQPEPGWACAGMPSACAATCGDGVVVLGEEACDDGNVDVGDGCAACATEPGWACVGMRSACTTGCGDGIVAGAEACDDGDAFDGDGCSASCAPELGWSCVGAPSVCATTCGDAIVTGLETCDDDDADDGDGCSATCTIERGFACSASTPSVCTATCGDGIAATSEACDDGDVESGDGCSATCEVEFAHGCVGEPSVCIEIDHAVGVALGDAHGCAWTSLGRVRCWGRNTHGEVGDGTRAVPAFLPTTTAIGDVAELDAGAEFTCALHTDGTVSCFGSDGSQQQGAGISADRPIAGVVPGVAAASAISTGGAHACALLADGGVTCWGDNDNLQLGRGGVGMTDSDAPMLVAFPAAAVDLDLGGDHGCAVLATGAVVCWGDDDNGQLGDGGTNTDQSLPVDVVGLTGIVQVSAGGDHSCARTSSGAVHCWGDNARGQLGAGTLDATTPIAVTLPGPATDLSAGARHTCATVGGAIYCWGDNIDGQLGDETRVGGASPAPVSGLAGVIIEHLSAGTRGTCAIAIGGARWCWGEGDDGALGILGAIQVEPAPVALSGSISSIAASRPLRLGTWCAVRDDGTVACWGSGETGILMDPTLADARIPREMTALSNVAQLGLGQDFACALSASGAVQCWGKNAQRQLGQGSSSVDVAGPTPVLALTGSVAEIAVGRAFACARVADEVRCWGDSATRQVGLDSTSDSGVPTTIPMTAGATAICAGSGHGCAVVATGGEVRCWGDDARGQLGDGSPGGARPDAQPVMGLGPAIDVVCGEEHSCALLVDGTVQCWGENGFGQVGDGGTTDRSAPRLVVGLAGITQLAAGWDHTCAVRDDATVACWGAGADGQLGGGDYPSSTIAMSLPGVSALGIEASASATCVLEAAGARCVGFHGFAQIGAGLTLRPLRAIGAPL